MIVRIQEGMRFQHNPLEKGNEFYVAKYDYFGGNEPIWCAVTDKLIYPLEDICLDEYMPMVNGQWVNEPVAYEF